jgi:hypothetical protein
MSQQNLKIQYTNDGFCGFFGHYIMQRATNKQASCQKKLLHGYITYSFIQLYIKIKSRKTTVSFETIKKSGDLSKRSYHFLL